MANISSVSMEVFQRVMYYACLISTANGELPPVVTSTPPMTMHELPDETTMPSILFPPEDCEYLPSRQTSTEEKPAVVICVVVFTGG